MAIGESVDLRSFDGQQLAVEIELDRVLGHVVEHSLVIIDGLVFLDHQQVAVGLPADQACPFGPERARFLLQSNGSDDARGGLQHFAVRQSDLRPGSVRHVLPPNDGRAVGQLDDDAGDRPGRGRLLPGRNREEPFRLQRHPALRRVDRQPVGRQFHQGADQRLTVERLDLERRRRGGQKNC